MNIKNIYQKIVALICMVVVFVSSIYFTTYAYSLGDVDTSSLAPITIRDFGIRDGLYGYNGGVAAATSECYNKTSLLNTVFTQKMTFNRDASARFGYAGKIESAWRAILIFPNTSNEGFTIMNRLPDSKAEEYLITPNSVDEKQLLGVELEWKLELLVDPNNASDVLLGVYINGKLNNDEYMRLEDCADKIGNCINIECIGQNATIQIGEIEPAPTIDENFTKLNFSSYGAETGVYTYDGDDFSFVGTCDLSNQETLDRVIFSDTVYFSNVSGTRLTIGGTKSEGRGMHWAVGSDGTLVVTEVNPEKESAGFTLFEAMTFTKETAGVGLVDRALQLTLSFEKVDSDYDGSDDDIKLGVWFDGKPYKNEWIYLKDTANYLGKYLGIATTREGCYIGVSSDNVYCNLANTSEGYMIAGTKITVDNAETANGSLLAEPKDYVVCYKDEEGTLESVKTVSVFLPGDVHTDNIFDVRDLVGVKKVMADFHTGTYAAAEAADIDRNTIINEVDCETLRKHLLENEQEEQIANTKDTYLTFEKDVMPIAGYNHPYRKTRSSKTSDDGQITWPEISYDTVTEDVYRLISEAGINLIYAPSHQENFFQDAIALAERFKIGFVVDDRRITENTTLSGLADYLKGYSKYEYFRGINIVDEPFSKTYGSQYYNNKDGVADANERDANLEDFAKRASLVNSYSNLFGYVNLNPLNYGLYHPNWAEGYEDATAEERTKRFNELYNKNYDAFIECYKQYLNDYIKTYNPKMISWDYYVFDGELGLIGGKRTNAKEYFTNLSVVREVALENQIPFWGFIQAGSNWEDATYSNTLNPNKHPLQGEMYWNVNTSLAYGAKGIQYFPLIQPYTWTYGYNGTSEHGLNSLIDAQGNPTVWHERAKNANKWIASVDHILLHATSKEVLAIGSATQEKTQITTSSDDILESVDTGVSTANGVVIGVFEYQGKKLYYVVNDDMSNANTVQLYFKKEQTYHGFLQSETEDDKAEAFSGNNQQSVSLSLVAGGAALLILD